MSDTETVFPDHVSYEELQEMKPDFAEQVENIHSDEDDGVSDDTKHWYNEAVWVAARQIVEAAQENEEFREQFLEDDSVGSAFGMAAYDMDRYTRLNSMGLSAFQGVKAEQVARDKLRDMYSE